MGFHQFPMTVPVGYKIHPNENMFHIEIDVPGMEASNLTVQLKEDGTILRIQGERKSTITNDTNDPNNNPRPKKKANTRMEACFSIDSNVDSNHMKVKLENGVLVIVAPKVRNKESNTIRKLEINHQQNTKPDNKSTAENDTIRPKEGKKAANE